MFGFIIFLVVVILVLSVIKKQFQDNKQAEKIVDLLRIAAGVGILFAILFKSIVQVDPGEVGVPILFGNVQETVLTSGLNFVNPLVEVEMLDTKTQAYSMFGEGVQETTEERVSSDGSITTLSADGLTLTLEITVWYRLNPGDAPQLLRTIGINYVDKIVRPAIRTSLRDMSVLYIATDIYSVKRENYVSAVTENLEKSFTGRGIILEKVLLRNVALPDKVREAIDEKISAEQRAQQMVFVLQKERQEAERKEIEAIGIAEAQRVINKTISQPYLQWKYIETLKELVNSPNNSFIITPFDQDLIPMFNVK
jgi:regulator of protease activity HflC (stomatin/prohibitin superfamily)